MTEKQDDIRIKLTNRHLAKLFSNIAVLKLPEIAINEIKREIWFLSEDLRNLYNGKSNKENSNEN